MIQIKRIYEKPAIPDGMRILVDRLWPRGIAKKEAHIDLWLKDVAPTAALRTWFNHDEQKWAEFKQKYKQELTNNESFAQLQELVRKNKTITLLYGAADTKHNQAVVLQELLQ